MPGPNPTFAETMTQWGKVIKIVNELEKFGNGNAANYLDMEDALTVALDGVFTPNALSKVRRIIRAGLAAGLTPANLRNLFRDFLLELSRVIAAPEMLNNGSISDAAALRRLREYMETNSQSFNSRGMTIDTSATSSGTGTGSVNRLTVDKDNNTLECIGAEAKVFYCDRDQTSGAKKHEEEFEFRFADAEVDGLHWTGTGGTARMKSLSCKSGSLLKNPSFETGPTADGTVLSTTGQLDGWDCTTASNIKPRSAAGYTYRGYPGEPTTLWGVEFMGNDSLIQVLRAENPSVAFDERVPYYCQIAWQRKASATGTLTLHLGSQSEAVDISTGTNDVWNVLRIPIGTKCWFDTFKEADLDVKIQVASLATGTVVVDDIVLAPMTWLDGTWWAIVGSATPWIRGDTHTFTDVDGGTRALFSYWLWRAFADQPQVMVEMRGWFPTDNAGGETVADPS